MKHETEPASAGPADRAGIRVARAARKKQAKTSRPKRGADTRRAERSRAKRVAAKPRVARRKPTAGRKRAAARPVAKKRAARKAATAKRVARKRTSHKAAAPKRVAKKRASRTAIAPRRVVRKVATSKRALRPPSTAPRREAAPRPDAPTPPAFAVQRAGASAREHLLFELQRARASVKAAVQGLSAGSAMRPVAPGKWTTLEIVLHLSERDRVRLEEFGRTLGGQPRSWAGIEDPEMAAVNEAHLAPLRAHTWDEALRRLDSLREELLLRLSEVPEQPDDVWKRSHPFGDMMWGLPEHDRHHAEQIKQARLGEPVLVEDRDV